MKIKLNKTMWKQMGKTAGWFDENDLQSLNPPAKSEKDIDFEVYNKWKNFKVTEFEPTMNKAILDMQLAIQDGDKEKYNKSEIKFDWAKKNSNIADAEIKRLKEKHGF
jgi:hypothetical protein